jgi:hypothetical protein
LPAQRDRAGIKRCVIAALATGLALLPWCISLWLSSNTPLFPLFAGNFRSPTLFSEPLGAEALASYVLECLTANRIFVLALLACLALVRRQHRWIAVQLLVASSLLVAANAITLTGFDSYTVLRYCAALVVPALIVLGALVWFSPRPDEVPWRRPVLAAIAGAWLFAPATTHLAFEEFRFSQIDLARAQARYWLAGSARLFKEDFALEDLGGSSPYSRAQGLLPAEARLVSAAERGYLWRRDTHTIHSLDFLGQASPDPGMPFFSGAEPVADYFQALGYTHLAFTPPRSGLCLYSAAHWTEHREKGQWIWRAWAPYFLDFMRTQRELARTRRVVFRGPTLVVVDLRERL